MPAAWNYVLEAVSEHPFNFFTLLFALAALAVSAIALIYSRLQAAAAQTQAAEASLTRRLNEEAMSVQAQALKTQAEDTGKALTVAERSAEAAERLAEANETLSVASQRAWIVPVQLERFQIYPTADNQVRISGVIKVENAGRTPAINVRLRKCSALSGDEPLGFVDGKDSSWGSVAPQDKKYIDHALKFTQEQYEELKAGTLSAWFFGNIRYFDVFGGYRTTYYRYVFDPKAGMIPAQSGNKVE